MIDQPKPCKKCGGNAIFSCSFDTENNYRKVECIKCLISTKKYPTYKEAIDEWNKMTDQLNPCSECHYETPEYNSHIPISTVRYRILCPSCGLIVSGYDKEKVFNKWNARAESENYKHLLGFVKETAYLEFNGIETIKRGAINILKEIRELK